MSSGGKAIRGSSTLVVRRMTVADAADVLALLQESPEAAPWSGESIAESTSWGTGWIAKHDGCVAGFLTGRAATDEFEILNMAVARASRRRGIAGRLVNEALRWSRESGARRAYLEVRASNAAAISLYRRHGFRECGRRQRYYRSPVEDAILFSMDVKGTPL